MADTVFEDFRNTLLLHTHLLRRLENGAVQQMVEPFNRAKQELTQRLATLQARIIVRPNIDLESSMNLIEQQLYQIDAILRVAALESAGTL